MNEKEENEIPEWGSHDHYVFDRAVTWTLRQLKSQLGVKEYWTSGGGTETIEGDVAAEIQDLLVAANLYDRETGEFAALTAEVARLREERDDISNKLKAAQDCIPDYCPITGLPFFMAIELDGVMVPTYGGPYDSYTIPTLSDPGDEVANFGEMTRRRYDHDEGCWSGYERVDERLVSEQRHLNPLWEKEDEHATLTSRVAALEAAGKWQPIETAPKDGETKILLLLKDGRIVTGRGFFMNIYSPQKLGGGHDVVGTEFGGYEEIESSALIPRSPTHWMPMPLPPAALHKKS